MTIQEIQNHLLHDASNFTRNNIAIDYQFRYEILTANYIEQTVDLFTACFCRSEPMTQYLQMNEEQYKIFARSVVEKAVADKISVIALDHNKVIACALSEDIADPGAIPEFDPKFVFILALLEKIGASFFKDKIFKKQHIAHLFITAVDANYRHKGLSTQINFHAMDVAKQAGFDFIYCEFTHYFNERGVIPHLKNKKKLIGSARYQDFIMDHKKPFQYLAGGAHAFLWEIRKNAKLCYEKNGKLFSVDL